MRILLEDSWEADDIIEWVRQRPEHELFVLNYDELWCYDNEQFLQSAYFCNTDIVQHHLEAMNMQHVVPDTYEISTFSKQLGRVIEKCKLGDIDLRLGSRFVKPVLNKKDFDGRVLSSLDDYEACGLTCPSLDTMVYHCQPFTFICEYRVLIGNNKVYGVGHMNKAKYTDGMDKFIESIVPLVSKSYKCVDIAYSIKPVARWVIVEINPPFSLDDYKIDLDSYMNFCLDSCAFINLQHN